MKPVLFVTNHIPPDRLGAFVALNERVPLQVALFGGRSHHATAGVDDPGVPHLRISQRDAYRLAADSSAVICGTAGRVALPASYLGARRAGVPFVLWTALWAHPRTPAHVLAGGPLLKHLYRKADAVVTYGGHVSALAHSHGAGNYYEAPQSVDNTFWSQPVEAPHDAFTVVFAGRPARYKGLPELLEAWQRANLAQSGARLLLVGEHEDPRLPGITALPHANPEELRNIYASADVLVMPAIATRSISEPWGLVANEAMNQGTPVIATDAVGAAIGGLIRDGDNGLVMPERDPDALAAALRRLHDDPQLRDELGAQARVDVAAYTFASWADGFVAALRSTGVGTGG